MLWNREAKAPGSAELASLHGAGQHDVAEGAELLHLRPAGWGDHSVTQ
jgi:hypothetical protein